MRPGLRSDITWKVVIEDEREEPLATHLEALLNYMWRNDRDLRDDVMRRAKLSLVNEILYGKHLKGGGAR